MKMDGKGEEVERNEGREHGKGTKERRGGDKKGMEGGGRGRTGKKGGGSGGAEEEERRCVEGRVERTAGEGKGQTRA